MSGSCVSKNTDINGTTRNALSGAKWHRAFALAYAD